MAGEQQDGFKAGADSAGGWLRKRGCLFWGIAIVVALFVIGKIAGPRESVVEQRLAESSAAESSGGIDVGTGPVQAKDVTPEELRAAYDENEVAAKQAYGGGLLRVKGTVAGITLDITDDPVVQLATANQFEDVQAPMGKEASTAAARLKKGQKITLLCEGVTEVIATPILKGCKIEPEAGK